MKPFEALNYDVHDLSEVYISILPTMLKTKVSRPIRIKMAARKDGDLLIYDSWIRIDEDPETHTFPELKKVASEVTERLMRVHCGYIRAAVPGEVQALLDQMMSVGVSGHIPHFTIRKGTDTELLEACSVYSQIDLDRIADVLSKTTPEAEEFFEERRRRGLGVGLDDDGAIVFQRDLNRKE